MQSRGVAGPVVVALIATMTVVVAVLLARPAERGTAPYPPLPVDPSPPDRTSLSLDRCATALESAGLDDHPARVLWEPLAQLVDDQVVATVLDARVPFVCVTGPTTVEVSDPAGAAPAGGASVLLTGRVLAVVAPPGGTVAVPGGVPGPVLLHRVDDLGVDDLGADDPGGGALVVDGVPIGPVEPVPPALSVTDRREIPPDRSAEAMTLLQRCLGVAPPDRFWVPALVMERDGATLLVLSGSATVGGCVVAPGRAEPVRVWRIGGPTDGPRPFVWLAAPPGAPPGTAGGPSQQRMVRMQVTAPSGETWPAAVGNRVFATHLPPGVDPDPRTLTVRAFDADGTLLFEGPAAS